MYRLLTAFAALVLTMNTCQAHPNHIGVTEVEWNAKTGRFEVAMKLRATDLEDAISVINKKRWRLETAEDKEQQIQSYLKQHFSITFKDHKTCRLHWVGSELLLHDVWVYFEAESLPGSVAKTAASEVLTFDELLSSKSSNTSDQSSVVIRNTTLMEIQPEQTHIVAMMKQGRRTTCVLNKKQASAEFDGSTAVAIHRSAN
ncbi:MAG: DUF6702 family protein [Fuerstiella sp.]